MAVKSKKIKAVVKSKSSNKVARAELLELKKSEKKIISKLIQSAFSGSKSTVLKKQESLILENFPLAVHVAKKYFGRSDTHKDLVQVASIGLVKAVRKFKPGLKISFASYAIPTIEGEIKHYIRDNAYMIKIPRKYSELGIKLDKYHETFLYREGREITDAELSKALKVKKSDVLIAKETLLAHHTVSLDAPVYSVAKAGDRDSLMTLENILGRESNINKMIERAGLDEALAELSDRDRSIIKDHFFRDLKQDAIAEKHSITQAQVSRIIKTSCQVLRTILV